jgi:hypothetical protein
MVDVRSEKERLYHQKYYKENKEAIIENHRKYNCENGKKIRERKRRYNHKHPKIIHAQRERFYEKNRERIIKEKREWQIRNPVLNWALSTISSHKKNGCKVEISSKELTAIALNVSRCIYCDRTLDYRAGKGRSFESSPSLDRRNNEFVIRPDNIDIICHKCNRTKLNRTQSEFLKYCQSVLKKFSVLFLALVLFLGVSCVRYNPSLFPSYDPLKPGAEVQILGSVNEVGWAMDDKGQILKEGIVVNQAFLIWVYELQQEIRKLRKAIK